MYTSPKMSMITTMAAEGYHCDGAGCVAECKQAAVHVIIVEETR